MLLLLLQKPLLPWLLMLYLHILPFLLLCSPYVPTAPPDHDMPPGLMAQVPPTYLALPTGWFSSLPPPLIELQGGSFNWTPPKFCKYNIPI